GATPRAVREAHVSWSRKYADSLAQFPHNNDRNSDRLLRIGYVSPDFKEHSVVSFFEPVLRSHDRSGFEVFCYSNTQRRDTGTERVRALCPNWRDITLLNDIETVKLIQADKIDLLIDL